ncbi:MAG: hypothetical protein ACLUE2_03460 [Bacteroides cellulosilyticus]
MACKEFSGALRQSARWETMSIDRLAGSLKHFSISLKRPCANAARKTVSSIESDIILSSYLFF